MASAAAVPSPAIGGLGSYKGVMLCNRPPEAGSGAQGAGAHPQPFKSTIAASCGERLGLQPAKQTEPKLEVKTRGPSAALRQHCQWIKELQEQVREDQRMVEGNAAAQEERNKKMQQAFKHQRDAILRIKSDNNRDLNAADVEAILRPKPKKSSAAGAQKPLWAMTRDEKEGFDDLEAEELIKFAEGLDFDQYIDDLEFRQQLQAVRGRAQNLQREQDAFKNDLLREFNTQDEEGCDGSDAGSSVLDDSVSVSGSAAGARRGRRKRLDGVDENKPEWDGSTACGDDRSSVDRDAQSQADRIMEANPQMKTVHSKGSVQRLIEKAQAGAAAEEQ